MRDKEFHDIDRRQFLLRGLAGIGAASVASATMPFLSGQEQHARERSSHPIRIGIIGVGPRGSWHLENLLASHPDVTVPAICELISSGQLDSKS